MCVCDGGGVVVCAMSNICPPESSDREVSAEEREDGERTHADTKWKSSHQTGFWVFLFFKEKAKR